MKPGYEYIHKTNSLFLQSSRFAFHWSIDIGSMNPTLLLSGKFEPAINIRRYLLQVSSCHHEIPMADRSAREFYLSRSTMISNFLTPYKPFESRRADIENFVPSTNDLRIQVPNSLMIIIIVQRVSVLGTKTRERRNESATTLCSSKSSPICLQPNRRDSSRLAWVALSK